MAPRKTAAAFILEAVRSGRGRRGGGLAGIHPADLLGQVLRAALRRSRLDADLVSDVMVGCVTQVGEQAVNLGRTSVLAAGLPIGIPAHTVNRLAGSGLQAILNAAYLVLAGEARVAIGAGVESMSRVPMGSDGEGPGEGPFPPSVAERFPNLGFPATSAEAIVQRWSLSREELDAFALDSQGKALRALRAGHFVDETEPVHFQSPNAEKSSFAAEECIRVGLTMERLAALSPTVLASGCIHPGNSSAMADGAAAVLVADEPTVRRLGRQPLARLVASAVCGSDPELSLTGPIEATQRALQRAGLTAPDVGLWEINEAFAPIPLIVARELGIPLELVNVNGGSIALGHPLGATGAMLVTTLVREMARRQARYGAVAMCIGFGMGITAIFERGG